MSVWATLKPVKLDFCFDRRLGFGATGGPCFRLGLDLGRIVKYELGVIDFDLDFFGLLPRREPRDSTDPLGSFVLKTCLNFLLLFMSFINLEDIFRLGVTIVKYDELDLVEFE